ncbi:methyl-accepting chemotaxis protein [Leptolyngbya sp. GGD]|uniref:methyl-accepting chemotaxis protein n=1 Tax=Leptolyngbya sp. GGD TaxID=2997907 RepID=UPI00227B26B5|nr:methyl-accepting chemotaxis protein [Leptolyngbya sp. GGD]MCY6490825.1 methyl-accepting chemotaxis protein [Leptolyngbya sp. GGD]
MVDQLSSTNSRVFPTQSAYTMADAARLKSRRALPDWLNRMSLKQRTALLAVVLSTVPIATMGAINYVLADHAITQQVTGAQQLAATRLSDLISRYMSQRYAEVQALANFPLLSETTPRNATSQADRNAALTRIAQAYGNYSDVAIFDLDGNVLVQAGDRSNSNQIGQAYFQEAIRNNRAGISQPMISADGKRTEVFLTAPVRDTQTGRTIGIVRATLPLEKMSDHLVTYTLIGREYSIIDPATNRVILTSRPERFNQEAPAIFPEFSQIASAAKVNTRSVSESQGAYIFTYSPWTKLDNLPELNWHLVLGNNVENAFKSRKTLLIALATSSVIVTVIVGWIAMILANRLTRRIVSVAKAVQRIGQGQLDTRLRMVGDDEITLLGSNINYMAGQLQKLIFEQTQTSQNLQRLNEATFNIRKTLDFNLIMQAGVNEVRKLIDVDRSIVYLFDEHWKGRIVAESVGLEFSAALGTQITDPCFAEHFIEKYRKGHVQTISNITDADLDPCYRGQLEAFQVKANIVAPMVVDGNLIGLLVGHHCTAPHYWESWEINLFTQIAVHLGNALEQVKLTEQQQRVTSIQALAEERQQTQEALQTQLLQLLRHVERAAMGDLTVRADVTTGEIGTVADFFNSIVENLQHLVGQVKEASLQVNSSLGSHEYAVRELAHDALKQAEETSATVQSVQKMMESIEAVAQSAQKAAEVSRTAAVTAETGGTAMELTVQQTLGLRHTIGDTAKKVKRLGESSQQISKAVSLINQITVQTNLLAINAGIEAARAGDDSQGFAAIAEEVAALAARAADATHEIEQLVAGIQRETNDVVEAMEEGTSQVVEVTHYVENAKQSLEQIVSVSHQIDQLVQSISTATVSQVETSHTITNLMQDIAQIAERTSDSSVEVSNSLRKTVDIAQELQQSVGTFKVN